MTFILSDRYPGRVNAASSDYPRGSFKNRTAPEAADGTYLEQDWKNDERAFQEALLYHAGITPNGNIDTALSSQSYDALMQLMTSNISTAGKPMFCIATGSSDALVANSFPRSVSLTDGFRITVRASYANYSTTPSLNAGATGARTICKGANKTLLIGDITGAGHMLDLVFDSRFNKWVLLNPAYGISQVESIPVGTIAYFGRNGTINGWLPMSGGEYSRAQYASLVSQCPNIILSGSSSSTFKLPDTRGLFIRVLDQGRGIDSNRTWASMQDDAIRNITGKFSGGELTTYHNSECKGTGAFYVTGEAWYRGSEDSSDSSAVFGFDASRVVPTASENRPKNVAVIYCIHI